MFNLLFYFLAVLCHYFPLFSLQRLEFFIVRLTAVHLKPELYIYIGCLCDNPAKKRPDHYIVTLQNKPETFLCHIVFIHKVKIASKLANLGRKSLCFN